MPAPSHRPRRADHRSAGRRGPRGLPDEAGAVALMPLSFLNPALLVGLAAAAVPVIIHFLSQRRLRRVAFSDLRFLREEEAHQARRRGMRRWLLMLLRILIIACLVLAAARPHWGGLPGGGGRATLFVVDASASMQVQLDDGRRAFDAAIALVGEMMGALPADASVQAIAAGPQAVPLFATWLPAGDAARAALAAAQVTDGAVDLESALREAARIATEAPSEPVDVVLVSDLQETDLTALDAAAGPLARAGARVLVQRVGDPVPPGAVVGLDLPGRALQPGETVQVRAQVRPDRPDQAFWLELDGQRVAEAVAGSTREGGAPVEVTFTVTAPGPGLHVGRVGKEADRLPLDDTRAFALEVPSRLEVVIAHGADRDGLGRGGWRYLARALAPDARTAGLFAVRAMPVDSLAATGLDGADLLVLADAGSPGRQLAATLRPWLEAGGAAMIMVGDPGQAQDLRAGVLPLLDLPAQARWVARADGQAERARIVDPGHPVFADLGDEALASLAAARWQRYFAVDEGDAGVLLVGDGGAPLLLEGQLGRGRWALLPFHLRADATDVMLNPVFLPVVQRLAARLVAGGVRAFDQPVGEELVLPVPAGRLGVRPGEAATALQVAGPPSNTRRPARLRWQAAGPAVVAPPAQHAGIHVFTSRDDTLGLVAATVPPAEMTTRRLAPDALAGALRSAGIDQVLDLEQASTAGFTRALAGRDLARWLLAAALVLLGVELWVGRRVG
ncbi:VWA domain-containing protein [bacterium]|nr:VWA domain-containing protein [bacterium]